MGCAQTRQQSPEETSLTTQEKSLLFYNKTATNADFVFRKFSFKSKLNAAQLRNAATKLSIRIDNFSDFKQVKAFYESLRTDSDCIPLKSLLLLSVLLAQGSASDKARILFEVYDTTLLGEMEGPMVAEIVADLFDVAVVKLPRLLGKSSDNETSSAKVYLGKICHIKETAASKLTKAITEESLRVSKKSFIDSFNTEKLREVLTTEGLRAYFFNEFATSPIELRQEFDRMMLRLQPLSEIKGTLGQTEALTVPENQ
jgi:hypothetical protein